MRHVKNIILLLVIAAGFASCTDETIAPAKEKQMVTISTRGDSTGKGFSFSQGKFVNFSSGVKPDILGASRTNDKGEILGPIFLSTNTEDSFHLKQEFNTIESAQVFFNSLQTHNGGEFQSITNTLQPGQVWVIRTNDGKLAKVLIHQIVNADTDGLYKNITLEWGILK
ncbi:MAG: hypothetical protein V4642_08030 [Bacteroidota bacterium]